MALQTWKQLYRAFMSLEGLRWLARERDGAAAAASLRALRSDNHEYEVDGDARFLLKCAEYLWSLCERIGRVGLITSCCCWLIVATGVEGTTGSAYGRRGCRT